MQSLSQQKHYCNTDLLVQFNIFQNLYGLIVVTKKGMKSQKSHQTKVTKHLVQRMSSKISRNRIRITATSIHLKQKDIHVYNVTNEHLSTSEKVKSISNDEKVTSVHTIKMKKEHGGYLRHHQRVDPQSYEHLHISALTHKAKSLQHPQSNTSSMLKFIWSLCISKSSQKLTSS